MELAVLLAKGVRDARVVGIGQWMIGQRQRAELAATVICLRMPARQRFTEDARMALLAAALADIGTGLDLEGIVRAIRTGAV